MAKLAWVWVVEAEARDEDRVIETFLFNRRLDADEKAAKLREEYSNSPSIGISVYRMDVK